MSSYPDVRYSPETPDHALIIDFIAADAFGPGRLARAAARVREMAPHDLQLSFVATLYGDIVGSVRQTPILVGTRPVLMLGPLAVRPAYKRLGIGRSLMSLAAGAARKTGESAIVLVGDRSYYQPLGYVPLPPGSVVMPGPADPARILGFPLVPGALEGIDGIVRPRP